MSKYTTGELAKLCEVSVRTVQFYDTKNLLTPSELTEGGRRLYSEDDLKKLRLICLLKSLGLSLDSIRGILDSEAPAKVLMLLLEEQESLIDKEIEDKQSQINAIKAVKENILNSQTIPVNSISDIEHLMKGNNKLKTTHVTMLVVGIIMDIIQIATLIIWITKGIWQPFVIGLPIVIAMGFFMTRLYYKNTAYICPDCNTKFKPSIKEMLFSAHTPKTRKLKCPHCGSTTYCVESFSDD